MFELNNLYNLDCMEAMKEIPDKYFQLAICDPPYGIGHDGQKQSLQSVNTNSKYKRKTYRKYHEQKGWDKTPPPKEYFSELDRISVNQIIWGGNYFAPMLKKGTKGWIVWDKGQHGLSMSDCELAYSSFECTTRIVVIYRTELQRDGGTIHPTQKPVKLYKWLLMNYAKPGDRIIDTHAGSGSCLVACYDMGFDFLGFEIDKGYYVSATERLDILKSQMRINGFTEAVQESLFADILL